MPPEVAVCAIHKAYDQDCGYCAMVVDINIALARVGIRPMPVWGRFIPSNASMN